MCECVGDMLTGRTTKAKVFEEDIEVEVTRCCLYGRVLSPFLWCLVVDSLLDLILSEGYYTQRYADIVMVLIRGQYGNTVVDLMKRALTLVEG